MNKNNIKIIFQNKNQKRFKKIIFQTTFLSILSLSNYSTFANGNPPLSYFIEKLEEAKKDDKCDNPIDSTSCRYEIVYRLGVSFDEAAIPYLADVLKNDKYTSVRAEAAESLGRIGSKKAIPLLKDALNNDPSVAVKLYAAIAILSMKENGNDVYEVIYKVAQANDRSKWSTKGFYNEMTKESQPTISDDVKTGWQWNAIKELENIPTKEAQKILEEQEKSSNKKIASYAKEIKENREKKRKYDK